MEEVKNRIFWFAPCFSPPAGASEERKSILSVHNFLFFSYISKYVRIQAVFTWKYTTLKRKILLLFSPPSFPDHQKTKMNYLILFHLLSRSSDNKLGIASALGAHLQ
ncbi:hypothetical protein EK904_012886 [Melospiza melodia maxima]|nr:hypothetical protein EK904_012886 [Melospiza melodia maxima]